MRTLIVSEFVTLDGVMEAPGGEPSHPHTNWVGDHPDGGHMAFKFEEIMASGLLLVGRVTYESFAGAWPDYEGEFADQMNGMPKAVVSGTLTDPAWNNTRVLRCHTDEDVVAQVTELKAGQGGPIMVQGSARLVHTLLDNDLVDELRLMVFPVTIGAGLRVFPDTRRRTAWRLTDSRTYDTGVRLDFLVPDTP